MAEPGVDRALRNLADAVFRPQRIGSPEVWRQELACLRAAIRRSRQHLQECSPAVERGFRTKGCRRYAESRCRQAPLPAKPARCGIQDHSSSPAEKKIPARRWPLGYRIAHIAVGKQTRMSDDAEAQPLLEAGSRARGCLQASAPVTEGARGKESRFARVRLLSERHPTGAISAAGPLGRNRWTARASLELAGFLVRGSGA